MSRFKDSADAGAALPAPLPLAEARRRILAHIEPVAGSERLALADALHRVVAEPATAALNVPGLDNSAMDGYAYAAASVAAPGARLHIAGQSLAGHPFSGRVAAGKCVRITTGGPLPAGTDTVVIQENVEVLDGQVVIREAPAAGANVRRAGEDFAAGDRVVVPGHYLRPADIAVLASVGVAEVVAWRRPQVAFFSTGDELRPLGTALAPGQIYESNRHGLAAQLRALGIDTLDLGIVGDDRAALAAALDAASACDAVITSGGVSVGDADLVRDVIAAAGQVDFWRVAIKPGKPLAFGRYGNAYFFGLPGNPVSTAVTFLQLVRPALVRLCGGVPAAPVRLSMAAAQDLHKNPGREHFLRARMDWEGDPPRVVASGQQGSGVMRSMSRADAFIVLPADSVGVAAGSPVTVEPFAQTVWDQPDRAP